MNFSYEVDFKERLYFGFKVIFSVIIYAVIALMIATQLNSRLIMYAIPALVYLFMILIALHFYKGLMLGYLRGNALKITSEQFPEIMELLRKQCDTLGLKRRPTLFVVQNGGLLNAFASRFSGKHFIVLYSDLLEEAYENNFEAVAFVLGHELGHVKRNHLLKNTILFPSAIIPFLQLAYSRGCEYTCDNIGAALAPAGARNGLFLLAAGKKMYNRVNMEAVLKQMKSEKGFWVWMAEKISTHPRLTRRIARFEDKKFSPKASYHPIVKEEAASDHSRYMPV